MKKTVSAILYSSLCTGLLSLPLGAVASPQMVCEGTTSYDIAWSFGNRQHSIFVSDRTEERNIGVSTTSKKQRILNRIQAYHNGINNVISAPELADTIAWAAECTGNDFTYLSAIFEAESNFCLHRHNTGGGDSGCGQFTSSPINELKSQLRLPGQQRNNNASQLAKSTIEEMVRSCFEKAGTPGRYNDFMNLFSQNRSHIQQVFRAGTDVDIDVLASAVFLKLMVSVTGGYIVPGTAPGGIWRYNGGGVSNYVSKITGNAQKVNFTCEEDLYSDQVGALACELSDEDKKQQCHSELAGEIII